MDDLSLHLLQTKPNSATKLVWTRQESLATLSQVEVLQQVLANQKERVANSFSYVKTWNDPISIVDAPARIIQRYTENFM